MVDFLFTMVKAIVFLADIRAPMMDKRKYYVLQCHIIIKENVSKNCLACATLASKYGANMVNNLCMSLVHSS